MPDTNGPHFSTFVEFLLSDFLDVPGDVTNEYTYTHGALEVHDSSGRLLVSSVALSGSTLPALAAAVRMVLDVVQDDICEETQRDWPVDGDGLGGLVPEAHIDSSGQLHFGFVRGVTWVITQRLSQDITLRLGNAFTESLRDDVR